MSFPVSSGPNWPILNSVRLEMRMNILLQGKLLSRAVLCLHRQTHKEKLRTGQNIRTVSDKEIARVCLINLNGFVFPKPVSL